MKKLNRHRFYLFLLILSLSACQSVKDGLTGQKKSNSDEFLIEKKNPLILPPDYGELLVPTVLTEVEKTTEKEIDIRAILTKQTTKKSQTTNSIKSSGTLEKNILEKIKKN